MRTYEQIQAYQKVYQKAYREANREKVREYKRKLRIGTKTKMADLVRCIISYETEVLKIIPNPFGSFEKATYAIKRFKNGASLYSFTTTCHNTEDCIEILKREYISRSFFLSGNFCLIYKIQNGDNKLIFKGSI